MYFSVFEWISMNEFYFIGLIKLSLQLKLGKNSAIETN